MSRSPLRSDAYLAWIRKQPCAGCCATQDIHAHHHGRMAGGMGIKTCDLHTVPLCPRCHGEWHQRGRIRELSGMDTQLVLWKEIALLLRRAYLEGVLTEMGEPTT